MDCDSCGTTLPMDGVCPRCGEPPVRDGDSTVTRDQHPLVTDGGKDPSDDPLSPTGGDDGDDGVDDPDPGESTDDGGSAGGDDGEYLDPDEIVDDEDLDGSDEPPASADEPAGQPPEGQPGDQPPQGQPGDQPPQGQPGDQPPQGPPGDQPPQGPPNDQPSQGQPGDQPPQGPPNDQPPQGQPGDQPPQGQPGDQPPQGQPPQGPPNDQPPQGQPGDQPPQGQPPQGQPGQGGPQGQPGGQPPQGQPPQGQSGPQPQGQGSQPAGGQPPGGQPAGQPAGGQPGQGAPQATAEGQPTIADQIKQFPLVLGSLFGAAAALVPFAILSALTIVAKKQPVTIIQDNGNEGIFAGAATDAQRSQAATSGADLTTLEGLDVSAELLFSFLTFGSGARIRDIFVTAADTDLSAVDPGDYPNWESELDVLVTSDGMLFTVPEAPFLILYIITPYILFVGSRFLARHYAPSDSPLDHIGAGATVTLGILPVLLLVGLVFSTTALVEPILVGGVALPVVIGSLGGLSVYAYDDISQLYSKFFGWGAILIGFLLAIVLVPTPSIGSGGISFSLPERAVIGLAGYLEVMELNLGAGSRSIEGWVLFGGALIITFFAGFLRAWVGRANIDGPVHGARVGASIFLGFVASIALLLWVYPVSLVFIDLSFGLDMAAAAYLDTIIGGAGDYLVSILIAGVIVPMFLGAAGGAAALLLDQQGQSNSPQQQYSQQPPQ